MMPSEVTELLDIAEQYWPKANGFECGLLGKRMKHLFLDDAKVILEEAKMESSYQTLPMKDIAKRLRAYKPKQTGQKITCYALDQESAGYIEAVCLANSEEGARVEMAKFLRGENHMDEFGHKKWELDPTDYIIFTDFNSFFDAKHEILRKLDPDMDRKVAKFAAILKGDRKLGQLLKDVPEAKQNRLTDKITVAIEKKGFQFLPAIDPEIEAQIEAEKAAAEPPLLLNRVQSEIVRNLHKKETPSIIDGMNIKADFDPEVPDDCPF